MFLVHLRSLLSSYLFFIIFSKVSYGLISCERNFGTANTGYIRSGEGDHSLFRKRYEDFALILVSSLCGRITEMTRRNVSLINIILTSSNVPLIIWFSREFSFGDKSLINGALEEIVILRFFFFFSFYDFSP